MKKTVKKAQLGKKISGSVPKSVKVDTSGTIKSMNKYMEKSDAPDSSWRKIDSKKDSTVLNTRYGAKKAKVGAKVVKKSAKKK